MTLVANQPWDELVREDLKLFASRVGETYKECSSCGCPFVTCKTYQEDLCVECSGTYESYNREKRREQQRIYQRTYIRVAKDRRRKEYKNT